MKVRVQVIIEDEDQGKPIVVREVFDLTRGPLATCTLGLGLEKGKSLLAAVQEVMTETQVNNAIAEQVACPDCGTPRRHKDTRHIVVRTLFGKLKLPSPRWWHCPCTPQFTKRSALSPRSSQIAPHRSYSIWNRSSLVCSPTAYQPVCWKICYLSGGCCTPKLYANTSPPPSVST